MNIKMKNYQSKLSILTFALLAALGAQAGTVISDFIPEGTLTAAQMNEIKDAVNGNDTRSFNNEGDIITNTSNISDHETRISDLEIFNKSGVLYGIPTSCMRGTSGGAALANTNVSNPPGNSFGPSLTESSQVDGTYIWYCNVPIQIPAGTTFTLTGATLGYFDHDLTGTTCLVGAQIKTKIFGARGTGTIISEVYSGVDANDFSAVTVGGPATKDFPAYSQVITTDTIVFINAIIKNTAGTGGDCRYSGVKFNYTVSQ